jgi:hypothetical protein
MAIVTISTIKTVSLGTSNMPGVVLGVGDTLNLLASGGIFDYATGTSPGISGAGSNSLLLNSDVFSAVFGNDAVNIAAGGNDVNVGSGSTISGANMGINLSGGGNAVGIAGQVTGLNDSGIHIAGAGNTVNGRASD